LYQKSIIAIYMGLIHLENLEFYAYHGCYKEEQIAGTKFMVNVTLETNMDKPAISDDINDALNYQLVYNVIKYEMSIQSNLLEHIAKRILDALFKRFSQLEHVTVKIAKMNPPMGGIMKSVSVEMSR
jgi:7,8-dihydroneopterin aldolase/epimerase/oxygenase